MAVVGQRIVAIREDNIVDVYDAVTGVLRLSLNSPQQVTKAEGSPDGSILFFAHQRAREITVWDTQTGGLIHTLPTMSNINNIAVSSKGRYLGSYSSNGTSEFWEVGGGRGGSYSLGQAVVCICWLDPEDQVALALKQTVVILEVTTGRRKLYNYPMGECVRGISFSTSQHRLAVLLAQGTKNSIGMINPRAGIAKATLPSPPGNPSCLVFSDDGSHVICATNTGDILSYTPKSFPPWIHHLGNLGTIHPVSPLRGGHLVVNSRESIQLLGLEYTRPPKASGDPGITHIYQLDTDEAICGSSRDRRDIKLLDMETMNTLANHRIKSDILHTSFAPRFLCASVDQADAILHLRNRSRFASEGYEVSDAFREVINMAFKYDHSWRPVLLGALSPGGWYLVAVSGGGDWELCVREVQRGDGLNNIPSIWKGEPPSKIAFRRGDHTPRNARCSPLRPRDGDKSGCEDHHFQTIPTPSITSEHPSLHPQELYVIPRTATSNQPEVRHTSPRVRTSVTRRPDETTTSTTNSKGRLLTGIRYVEYRVRKSFSLENLWRDGQIEELPWEEFLPGPLHPYSLDENLEWVVDAKSRRVCWLPPGYVTGIEDGHFFVGSSIVMAGKDGIVRKLTFREPRSDP